MERSLLERLQRHLDTQSDSYSPLRALASARTLITNPASSDSTREAVLDALLRFLDQRGEDPLVVRHAVKVLGEIAALHPSSVPPIVGAVRPLRNSGKHLVAEALSVLNCIAEITGEVDGFSVVRSVVDEDCILSLASSPYVSVRLQLLDLIVSSLGERKGSTLLQPALMVQLLLGLSEDLYPSVRRASLDGLVALCKGAGSGLESWIVDCFHDRAVELLRDEDELVRSAAIRLVSECGQMFAVSKEGNGNTERMDLVFLQLCSMGRDMTMKVRLEAFIALGKVRIVSEKVLLQSLSKKVLGAKSGKSCLVSHSVKDSKLSLAPAAGAFVHGIEDEFYEVRTAACKSLGMLAVFSLQFAVDALNLLMDMLNDDATVVRLQTLQTLFYMARYDHLKVQEKHMHMFLGLLGDISATIRTAARKVLQLMRLPDLEMFKSSIDSLITNLETYPEEEEDIFLALFFIGKNHGIYAAKVAKKVLQEMVPFREGELSLDGPQVAAFLVLAISSSISKEDVMCELPEAIFSLAIPLFGRISCSLRSFINRDALLAYLFHHSKLPLSLETKEDKLLSHDAEAVISDYMVRADQICRSLWPIPNEISDIPENILDLNHVSAPLEKHQQKGEYLNEEVIHSIKLILKAVAEARPLKQSHCTLEVSSTLRACKEELEMIAWHADGSYGALLAFTLQYVHVIQLFTEILEQLQPKKFLNTGTLVLDILLEKLEMSLRRMRYGFRGLSKEEKSHILELILLGHVLKLSKVGVCPRAMLKKLYGVVSQLELACEDGSSNLSYFANEVKKFCTERISSEASSPFPVHKLLELFHLDQIKLIGRFKHITAELLVPGNDSENPLPYVSGLPVGITFLVTLSNILDNDRVWLWLAVGESIQYVYLDLCQEGVYDEVRKLKIDVPFYATPKAAAFILRVSIVMECPVLDVMDLTTDQGGPKGDVMLLSEEREIYLVRIGNNS